MMLLAALCHDFGKVVTTTMNESGRIISPDHASQGVPIAQVFLESIGCFPRMIERVLPLVAEHMTHVGIQESSRRVVARLARRLGQATIHEWSMIVEADHSGRPPLAKGNPVKHWVALAELIDVGNGAMKPIIMGRHLIQLGMKPSKEFGAILSAAMDAQENGDFVDEVHGIQWLRKFISKGE
jgi:tRNA nucleotidyltransferase (CCA-adding enzyme)